MRYLYLIKRTKLSLLNWVDFILCSFCGSRVKTCWLCTAIMESFDLYLPRISYFSTDFKQLFPVVVVVIVSGMQLKIAWHRTSTTASTETGSGPCPLLQAVWDCGFSDPAVWCSAMWCGGVLAVFSSPLEGDDTILLASMLSFICSMCPKRCRWCDWTIAVSLDCPVSLWTSSLRTNWCLLIPSSSSRPYHTKIYVWLLEIVHIFKREPLSQMAWPQAPKVFGTSCITPTWYEKQPSNFAWWSN